MATQVSNALTLVMKIKSPQDAQALGEMLLKLEEMGDKSPIRLALDEVGTVHFARFVFLSNNTELAVITSYDGDFDQYLIAFTKILGGIFDQLFAHVADAPPLPVASDPAAFSKYVSDHNQSPMTGSLYCAYPQATVQTILTLLAQNG